MSFFKAKNKDFTDLLIKWHIENNKRIMPWTNEKDIYKIWISEIILQQTRVEQGISYYLNFIEKFPDIKTLASAPDNVVFKAWEGLGYYTRCKNLIFSAKKIITDLNGKFPETYKAMLELRGIGPYTAAAISSFAFGLPHAVVDGNVFRVLARFFGDSTPIDSTRGKHHFTSLANELLYIEDSGAYNQAIMDFGATVCKPQIPLCGLCVLQKDCKAFADGTVNQLPFKEKRLIKRKRFFTYFIFSVKDKVLINKRAAHDIWQNLHEFYCYESEKIQNWKLTEINEWMKAQLGIKKYTLLHISKLYSQQLTHQRLYMKFVIIEVPEIPLVLQHFSTIAIQELTEYAFPKVINDYLKHEFLNAIKDPKFAIM